MSGKVFFDTNVLFYAFDMRFPEKQTKAKELFSRGGCISFQVVHEFVHSSLKKKLHPVAALKPMIESTYRLVDVLPANEEMVWKALQIAEQFQYSYFDALIISTALLHRCNILYTEDLQHKQKIESLTIINPFV